MTGSAPPTLPVFAAQGYSIYGAVTILSVPTLKEMYNYSRSVSLLDTSEKELQRVDTIKGKFSFHNVAPGAYKILPAIRKSEKEHGLLLAPASSSITVANTPLLGVDFSVPVPAGLPLVLPWA